LTLLSFCWSVIVDVLELRRLSVHAGGGWCYLVVVPESVGGIVCQVNYT